MAKAPVKTAAVNTTALTEIVAPKKARPGQQSQPPGREVERGQDLTRNSEVLFRQTVDTYLTQNKIADAVRAAVRQMGTVGTAHFNLIEMAMTGWKATAYDPATNEISEEGQVLLNALLVRLNTITDYSVGYDDKIGIDRTLEMMINDVICSGGHGLELVLDDSRVPDRLVTFPYDTLTYRQGGDYRYPVQRGTGEERELNYPTIFVGDFHRAVNDVYAWPMFESALREGRAYEQFLQDMRRAVKRAGHGRLVITLDYARITEVAPQEIKDDPNKLAAWAEEIRQGVVDIANELEPEDAFVTYDVAKADMLKSEGEKSDYVSLMNALSGNLATALKSNPSTLGLRIEGSQSLSNTESLITIKVASSVRRCVEESMSKALTLGCRLMGSLVYVEFKMDSINLRPESELAAFRTMEMDRDLRLLSLGLITDLEFSVRQGLGTIPAGYKPLSGTGFYESKSVDASKATPNNGAQEKALTPDTPSKAGGDSQ